MRSSWAGIFLMLFLVGGGMLIGTSNAAFVDSNMGVIGLASLASFGIFMLLVYEDLIRGAFSKDVDRPCVNCVVYRSFPSIEGNCKSCVLDLTEADMIPPGH